MPEKPFALKPMCIVAILFGALGLMGSATGLLALYLNPKPQRPAFQNPKQQELNDEFVRRTEEMAAKARPWQIVVVPCVGLTSLLLLGAGIAGLKLQALGFIRLAFAASLLMDSIASAFNISTQIKTMEIMKWYFRENAANSGNAEMAKSMAIGMQAGVFIGLFFAVGWLVAKTGFYVGGLVYFNKRSVKDLFHPPSAPPVLSDPGMK